MMTEQHIKEGLSRAYFSAVTFRAGFSCSKPEFDYGIDGTINDIQYIREGRHFNIGFGIDYQLKSTNNVQIDNEYVTYDLEAKTYKDLIIENIGTARILILFVLPVDKDHWLNVSSEQTVLKNCAWWYILTGMPPTTNDHTIRIKIPKEQIFSPQTLSDLMAKVRKGDEICNLK